MRPSSAAVVPSTPPPAVPTLTDSDSMLNDQAIPSWHGGSVTNGTLRCVPEVHFSTKMSNQVPHNPNTSSDQIAPSTYSMNFFRWAGATIYTGR